MMIPVAVRMSMSFFLRRVQQRQEQKGNDATGEKRHNQPIPRNHYFRPLVFRIIKMTTAVSMKPSKPDMQTIHNASRMELNIINRHRPFTTSAEFRFPRLSVFAGSISAPRLFHLLPPIRAPSPLRRNRYNTHDAGIPCLQALPSRRRTDRVSTYPPASPSFSICSANPLKN